MLIVVMKSMIVACMILASLALPIMQGLPLNRSKHSSTTLALTTKLIMLPSCLSLLGIWDISEAAQKQRASWGWLINCFTDLVFMLAVSLLNQEIKLLEHKIKNKIAEKMLCYKFIQTNKKAKLKIIAINARPKSTKKNKYKSAEGCE